MLKRCELILFFCLLSKTLIIAQKIEWANKITHKSIEYQSDWNYPEAMLGPPSIYPNHDYEAELFDLYADGYILYADKNKSEITELGFIKPVPANQMVIGGIFNDGVIRKAYITLKDNKQKLIYTAQETPALVKKSSLHLKFKLETVYGIKLVIDHSKINKWNIIKGVGICKSDELVDIKPDLYDQAEFPFPKDSIGHNINTHECFEFNPRLSSDGSKMYFVKECPGIDNQDIWVTEADASGRWKEAHSVGSPLNNAGHNFVASASMDGNTLFIGNTYNSDGEQLGAGLSMSKWQTNRTWSLPENIEIPNFVNKSSYGNYFMAHDQSAILMALENEQSNGEMDLYVSLFNKYKKSWSEPINLGNVINTSFGEDYPYLALDGNVLYFSSKGHIGYGGHDIYMSKRLDNSWTKWSKPVNLGPLINTKTDDNGFMISNSGDYAYFNTVTFDSIHNMDIYKIKLPKILQQHPHVLIKGKVLSTRDGKPVHTIIRFKEKGKNVYDPTVVTNDMDGNFAFILPHGKEYDIVVEGSNYFKITDKIALLDSNVKSKVLKNYKIEPFLDSGQVSVMSNVLFDFGTAKLRDTSFHELNRMVSKLQEQNKSVIEISGHTDDVGSDEFNLKLSESRAMSVVNYLIEKGIRPWRLKAKGYGEQVPIASNDTEEGRTLNRRVEMLILEDDFSKRYQKKQSPVAGKKQRFNFYSNVVKEN
jgi:outer membrane protein OmpA-like peptidoglycan-associated protein